MRSNIVHQVRQEQRRSLVQSLSRFQLSIAVKNTYMNSWSEVIGDLKCTVALVARQGVVLCVDCHCPIRHVSCLHPIHLLARGALETTLGTGIHYSNSVWKFITCTVMAIIRLNNESICTWDLSRSWRMQ